ncbi:hypothetical protein AVEN_51447-1 [Araneus ventricosus]|uniref:Uncharacterized protein n=1 Tax=Araneus ventricosus TaxID=182803 RepID=A0A4Y2KDK3_ARAVE|nr:hypothetical protein AVEN_51447-1 [Araneus ventricosus]
MNCQARSVIVEEIQVPHITCPSLIDHFHGMEESAEKVKCPGVNTSISCSPPFQMSLMNNPEVIASKNGTAFFSNDSQKYIPVFLLKKVIRNNLKYPNTLGALLS